MLWLYATIVICHLHSKLPRLLPGSLDLLDLQPHRMPVEARLASGEWRNIEASASVVPKVLQKLLARSGSESWVSWDLVRHGKHFPSFSLQIYNVARKGLHGFWSDFTVQHVWYFLLILLHVLYHLPLSTQHNNLKLQAPGCCRISASAWSMSSLRIRLFRSASLNRSRRSITFLVDGSGWQWERETITLEMRFAPSPVAFRILVQGTSDKRSAKHRFTMCIQLCRKLLAAHRSPACTKRKSHCSLPRCWWCVTKQSGGTSNLLWKVWVPD